MTYFLETFIATEVVGEELPRKAASDTPSAIRAVWKKISNGSIERCNIDPQ